MKPEQSIIDELEQNNGAIQALFLTLIINVGVAVVAVLLSLFVLLGGTP